MTPDGLEGRRIPRLSPVDAAVAMSRYGLLLVVARSDLPRAVVAVLAATALGLAAGAGPWVSAAVVAGLLAAAGRRARQWRLLARHHARTVDWDATCDLFLRHGHVSANPGGRAARVFAGHRIPDTPLCGPEFTEPGMVCMVCIDVVLDHPEAIGGPVGAELVSLTIDGTAVPADPVFMAALIADNSTD